MNDPSLNPPVGHGGDAEPGVLRQGERNTMISAATGGRIVASLAKMLHERGSGRGLISICTAGGMGVTAILSAA